MKGDKVLVRVFGGNLLTRYVWEIGAAKIYLLDKTQFDLLNTGKPALGPIGFPKEDVFEFSERKNKLKPYLSN